MCPRSVDRLIGTDTRGRIIDRLRGYVVVKAAVSGIDMEGAAAFDVLQAISGTQPMRERIAQTGISYKAVQGVGSITDGQ